MNITLFSQLCISCSLQHVNWDYSLKYCKVKPNVYACQQFYIVTLSNKTFLHWRCFLPLELSVLFSQHGALRAAFLLWLFFFLMEMLSTTYKHKSHADLIHFLVPVLYNSGQVPQPILFFFFFFLPLSLPLFFVCKTGKIYDSVFLIGLFFRRFLYHMTQNIKLQPFG